MNPPACAGLIKLKGPKNRTGIVSNGFMVSMRAGLSSKPTRLSDTLNNAPFPWQVRHLAANLRRLILKNHANAPPRHLGG